MRSDYQIAPIRSIIAREQNGTEIILTLSCGHVIKRKAFWVPRARIRCGLCLREGKL